MGEALAAGAWCGGHPPGLILVALAFLVPSTSMVFETSPRRPLQYPFAFGALALFLLVGPFAVRVVLLATLAGVVLRWPARGPDPFTRDGAASPAAMLIVGGAVALGILVGSGVAWLLGVGYPVPLDGTAEVGRFVLIVVATFVALVASKELCSGLLARHVRVPTLHLRATLGVYTAAIIIGLPMHVTAQALYARGDVARWTLALAWAFLINAVIGNQLERMRRTVELREELARKERLAAIGEVTARVLHHTRHQMGLVGMIAHQIMRRLDRLPPAEASAIAEELAKLKAVQEDLQQALTIDVDVGVGAPRPLPHEASVPPYETLIRSQSARLEPLAAERSVAVAIDVADGVPPGLRPKSPVKLGHAFSNVLENAISAARGHVAVRLFCDRDYVVISVADDGPGMPDDFIVRATEPFVTTKREGSGMGLAITRAVVEEEDGALEIRNRAEGGLVVRMRLPARQDSIS